MEAKSIIEKFIRSFQLLEREDLLGIIFYGSSCYQTNTSKSDIDLLLVTDGCYNYKAVTYIDGQKIEYFERNIYDLLKQLEHLEQNPDRSFLSIFQNGEIIFSKNQMMEYLRQEALAHSKYIPKRSKYKRNDPDIAMFYHILQQANPKSAFGQYVFYNLVEKIRKKYHKENGYTKMPVMKAYMLYNDKSYAEKFYCQSLPNIDFIEQYLNLISEGFNEARLKTIMSYISYSDLDSLAQEFPNYSKEELKYSSTIVKNAVDKSCFLLEEDTKDSFGCYCIALEKIRRLYCDINGLSPDLDRFGEEYDQTFLNLFDACLNNSDRMEAINQLFSCVTTFEFR